MQTVEQYATQHRIQAFSIPTILALQQGTYEFDKVDRFKRFLDRVKTELLSHPIINSNPYCEWFAQGKASKEQVRHFIVQFSVFSNQFLVAQLHKMLNADSLEEMRASKEILANEIGVIFSGNKPTNVQNKELQGDPDVVSVDGSIDGGQFRFRAAHFEWLLQIGQQLGIEFNQMGKRKHGSETTLHFCDELIRLYGSDNYLTATASSYAVENWAAAGFWDQLVAGLKIFRVGIHMPRLPIAFFTWHSKLEANHALHTQEELEEYYFTHDVDEDKFIADGRKMLDGVQVFWQGLDATSYN